jgi:hypothetical protein
VVLQAGQLRWEQWKRSSHLTLLARTLDPARFRAASRCWTALRSAQKPWRCLEVRYLGAKCKMLEEFMHQVLWESASPLLVLRFLNAAS